MADLAGPGVDAGSQRPCPSCGTAVAPELDADLHYFECEKCGYQFGWLRNTPADTEMACPAGLPLAEQKVATPVLLQIGTRVEKPVA